MTGLVKNNVQEKKFERQQMETYPYATAIGCLMYAQTCTRADISFAIGMLIRYHGNTGMTH